MFIFLYPSSFMVNARQAPSFLKSEVPPYKQQTDKILANFKNSNLQIELKIKISFLDKESFDLRNQQTDKHVTIHKLKTNKDSTTLKSTKSPPTLTIIIIDGSTGKRL